MEETEEEIIKNISSCGYQVNEALGKGSYGSVFSIIDGNGDIHAIKYLRRRDNDKTGLDSLLEVDIMSRFSHPNIIHAEALLTNEDCDVPTIAIIMPMATESLYHWSQRMHLTSEKLDMLHKVACAMAFLHSNGILHLDLKEDNVVLVGPDSTPLLIDFGFAAVVEDFSIGYYSKGRKGTAIYEAPELFSGQLINYSGATDVWAFGIMALYLLSETDIFPKGIKKDAIPKFIPQLIEKANVERLLQTISDPSLKEQVVNFILSILQLNSDERPTMEQICNSSIFGSSTAAMSGTVYHQPYTAKYPDINGELTDLILGICISDQLKNERASLMFIAFDIYYRSAAFFAKKQKRELLSFAAACVFIAAKISMTTSRIDVNKIVTASGNIVNPRDVLRSEIRIVKALGGILVNYDLYDTCNGAQHMAGTLARILLSEDPTLYSDLELDPWKQDLIDYYGQDDTVKKTNITISDVFTVYQSLLEEKD